MPKWMDKCVASYQKQHPDDDEASAWAVCTTQYKKKFGHSPTREDVAESLLAIQEAVGTEGLQLTFSDSEKESLLRQALELKFKEESGDVWVGWWFIVSVYDTHVVVFREEEQRLFAVPYIIVDRYTANLGDKVEVVAAHVQEETEILHLLMFEGWLPPKTTVNDLPDSSFAWLSNEYFSAGEERRAKMNKREHRQLPYKLNDEVNLYGWLASMRAVNWSTYLRPSFEGGPDRSKCYSVLMEACPKQVSFDEEGEYSVIEDTGNGAIFEATLSGFMMEEATIEEKGKFAFVFSANAIPKANTEHGVYSRNRRLYPPDAVDETYDRTQEFLLEGGVATIYTSHTAAMPAAARLPVGKVLEIGRAGTAVKVRGGIVDTVEGQDAVKLLDAGVLSTVSLRTHRWESHMEEVGELGNIEVMDWCVIQGVDFTSAPGLPDTQVKKEEVTMDLKDLTLEELNSQRPDLVEELLAGHEAEPTFQTPPEDVLELAILQAASTGIASVVAAKLRAVAKTVEEIEPNVEQARKDAVQEVFRGREASREPQAPKGESTPAAEVPPKVEDEPLSDTKQEIITNLGGTLS